jgi:hypothetical protein
MFFKPIADKSAPEIAIKIAPTFFANKFAPTNKNGAQGAPFPVIL